MIISGTRVQLEARLSSPRWLVVVVPVISVLFALVVGGIFLVITGHPPLRTYGDLLDNGYTSFYVITSSRSSLINNIALPFFRASSSRA